MSQKYFVLKVFSFTVVRSSCLKQNDICGDALHQSRSAFLKACPRANEFRVHSLKLSFWKRASVESFDPVLLRHFHILKIRPSPNPFCSDESGINVSKKVTSGSLRNSDTFNIQVSKHYFDHLRSVLNYSAAASAGSFCVKSDALLNKLHIASQWH